MPELTAVLVAVFIFLVWVVMMYLLFRSFKIIQYID